MPIRPAAVVFDMDGLLFDSEALYREAFLVAARDLGHSFTAGDFLELVGRPWTTNRATLQARLDGTGDADALKSVWMRHYEAKRVSLALKAGVAELLDRLDELGLPRAICTSSSHADVHHNLALHRLDGRFNAVVAAGDYARGKPAPDAFLRAAEVLGVAAGDCLALETPTTGYGRPAAAGMCTVMVPDLLPATEEVRALCHCVAASLHEVCALLD